MTKEDNGERNLRKKYNRSCKNSELQSKKLAAKHLFKALHNGSHYFSFLKIPPGIHNVCVSHILPNKGSVLWSEPFYLYKHNNVWNIISGIFQLHSMYSITLQSPNSTQQGFTLHKPRQNCNLIICYVK